MSQTPEPSTRGLQAMELSRHESLSVMAIRCDTRVLGSHDHPTISYVRSGSLNYRAHGRTFDCVPGSLIVAPPGLDYDCSHHRDAWAECISFRFAQHLVDEPVRHAGTWQVGCLPPVAELMVFGALAQSACIGAVDLGLDEIGMALAAKASEVAGGEAARQHAPRGADRSRALDAALWIEAHSHEAVDLESLSRIAGLSPYYFLRMFSAAIGVTPHQYLIRCRLRHAAQLLVEDELPVTEVAATVGFGDLSNFVRAFHRAAGLSPRRFRQKARGR